MCSEIGISTPPARIASKTRRSAGSANSRYRSGPISPRGRIATAEHVGAGFGESDPVSGGVTNTALDQCIDEGRIGDQAGHHPIDVRQRAGEREGRLVEAANDENLVAQTLTEPAHRLQHQGHPPKRARIGRRKAIHIRHASNQGFAGPGHRLVLAREPNLGSHRFGGDPGVAESHTASG